MPAGNRPEPSRILAVDDSPDNLFLIETVLDGAEYDLTCAKCGEEALEQVYQKPPDLILLDIMMPGMNGYEVTQQIRDDRALPYIPILLITAHHQVSLVEGLDSGADDFIRKPFDIEELQARIRSLLRLKQAIDAQAVMIRQRDDFVARLTHDLRTPLIAANRILQFCKEETFGTVADGVKSVLTDTIENNRQLLSMVNTLLEVHRCEAGYKALTFTSLNLLEVAIAVIRELSPLAQEKNLELTLANAEALSAEAAAYRMSGDTMELRRVITNLIGNAIKFTDEGFVSVSLRRQDHSPLTGNGGKASDEAESSPSHWLSLEVIDSGVGISPEDQAEIFKWFRQGKQRRSGSGLGLHLAYRIAEMHGGFITVDSLLNRGSKFTLWLPVAPP